MNNDIINHININYNTLMTLPQSTTTNIDTTLKNQLTSKQLCFFYADYYINNYNDLLHDYPINLDEIYKTIGWNCSQ